MAFISLFISICICSSLGSMVTGQVNAQSQCQMRFRSSATACMQNASLNIANVQYLASNMTSGQPPPENMQAFRQRVCAVKPQLEICGQAVTQQLLNSTYCLNQIDRQTIISSFKLTFGGLDANCAQPCRYRLMEEMRQCYSYVNTQPTVVSELGLIENAIIGDNRDVVDKFCTNRQALLQCMRQKILRCTDNRRVLAQNNFDITSFERGLDLLCLNQGVYVTGINCFKDPIREVRVCFQNQKRKLQNLLTLAPLPTADQVSLTQYCAIRLEQIDCEMGAWARHQYQTCERVVTGMRNELSCIILPDRCRMAYPQIIGTICNPLNYFSEDRDRYNSASTENVSRVVFSLGMLFAVSKRIFLSS